MITVLVNPVSGGGKAEKVLPEIEALLREEKRKYVVRRTKNHGDAYEIAKEAVKSAHEGIIVAGGDGTMSEVLDGVVGSAVAIIFAPCGTGNDFVCTFANERNTIYSLTELIESGKTVNADILLAGGKVAITFIFDSGFMWVIVMPLCFILSYLTSLPIIPLYFICQATEIIKAFFGASLYRKKTWAKSLVNNELQ